MLELCRAKNHQLFHLDPNCLPVAKQMCEQTFQSGQEKKSVLGYLRVPRMAL